MVIPQVLRILLLLSMALLIIFIVKLMKGRSLMMLHKCFLAVAVLLIIWIVAILSMGEIDPQNQTMLYILDSVTTCCGVIIVACLLLFSICYTNIYKNGAPDWWPWLFVGAFMSSVMVWTNPIHHLYYQVFSLERSKVVFGPYFYVHSVFTYVCVAWAVFLLIRHAFKTKKKMQIRQTLLLITGGIAPSVTNIIVLLTGAADNSIIITPLSFMITIMCHGFVIYKLHLFDVRPIAMQQLVEWLADGYLVTNQYGAVIQYNQRFLDMLGNDHGIEEGHSIRESIKDEDVVNKTAMFNLISAIGSCRNSLSRITYEQSLNRNINGEAEKKYYMVEITPLIMENNVGGFMTIFKDVTQMKVDMQKMQENQVKMMENERLAFLGQMVGGIAHNLKTPIMSVSGSVSAVERLIEECRESIGDEDVKPEDYMEIYAEVDEWLDRIKEAGSYMSDIIQAVKGQAQNMNMSNDLWFTLDDAIKRVMLLLRHELLNSGCSLIIDEKISKYDINIHGDINSLVQVINNLVVNSIDAQVKNGRRDILIDTIIDNENLIIKVTDFGMGISETTKKNLFRQMVTSKGTKGTGLGVFISNTVIKVKFDGMMSFEDNPQGGTIMNVIIPLKKVNYTKDGRLIKVAEE